MKKTILIILFCLAYAGLNAQETSQEKQNYKNFVTVNIGFGYYEVSMDHTDGDNSYNFKMPQLAFKIDYYRRIGDFMPGFGCEFLITPTYTKNEDPEEGYSHNIVKTTFFTPNIVLKYLLTDKFYIGTSVSYRNGTASRKYDYYDIKFDSEWDIWANIHAGILFTSSLQNFYTIELRAGYNLTNNLWENGTEKWTDDEIYISDNKNENVRSHDLVLYFGAGSSF